MDRPILISCPRCSRHHFAQEKRCPFCSEPASMKLAKAAMAVATPMVLAACYGTGKWCETGDNCGLDDSAEDSGATPGETTTDTTISAAVVWGETNVSLSASGGPGAYWFGMAETLDCDDCWTGEDCVFGYDASGTTLSYCHDAGDAGTTLTYGGDPAALGAGETVFKDSSHDGNVTYYLESDTDFGGDGTCYIWGADTSYYDGLGCSSL